MRAVPADDAGPQTRDSRAVPLATGLIVAVLVLLAVLALHAIVAAVPTLVVAGVVWAVVRAVRRRPGLESAFPR